MLFRREGQTRACGVDKTCRHVQKREQGKKSSFSLENKSKFRAGQGSEFRAKRLNLLGLSDLRRGSVKSGVKKHSRNGSVCLLLRRATPSSGDAVEGSVSRVSQKIKSKARQELLLKSERYTSKTTGNLGPKFGVKSRNISECQPGERRPERGFSDRFWS